MSKNNILIVRLDSRVDIPKKATDGSAGYDLQACLDTSITICPGKHVLIPTGIKIHIHSANVVALILPRSKLGTGGLVLKNTVGVIDSDYTGQWYISAWNSNLIADITIRPLDKIAQVVFLQLASIDLKEVSQLATTNRNDGGIIKQTDTGNSYE